jgi:hypothetical protein
LIGEQKNMRREWEELRQGTFVEDSVAIRLTDRPRHAGEGKKNNGKAG